MFAKDAELATGYPVPEKAQDQAWWILHKMLLR
jgi:hypothetical protein